MYTATIAVAGEELDTSVEVRSDPRIDSLMSSIDGAEARPSEPQYGRIEELKTETAQAQSAFSRLMETRVEPINEMMRALPQVVVGGEE